MAYPYEEEDRRAALTQGLLAAGLAALGARRGSEYNALGQAGLLGLTGYNAALRTATDARKDKMAMDMTAAKLKKDEELRAYVMRMIGGEQGAQPGAAAPMPETYGPGVSQAFGLPPNTPATQPPQQGPAQTSPMPGPSWRNNMPKEALALHAMAGDWKEFAKAMQTAGETKMGPDGTVTDRVGRPLYRMTPYGRQLFNADGSPGAFQAFGKDASSAEAERAGAIKGAEADATAARDLIAVPDGKGGTVQMTRADAVKLFSRQPPQAQAQPAPQPAPAAQQAAPPVGGGVGVSGAFGSTNPLAVKGAEAAIDTGARGVQALNEDWTKNSYRPAIDAAKTAKMGNYSLDLLDKLPLNDSTGWAAPAVAEGARVLTYLGIAPDKVKEYAANSELFKQAVMTRNWELLAAQKGMQTEGDAKRAMATWISLSNTPQANQYMRDVTRATNNLALSRASFYQAALQNPLFKGDYSKIDAAWESERISLWDDPAMAKWKKFAGQGGSTEEVIDYKDLNKRRR